MLRSPDRGTGWSGAATYRPSPSAGNQPASAYPAVKGKPIPLAQTWGVDCPRCQAVGARPSWDNIVSWSR